VSWLVFSSIVSNDSGAGSEGLGRAGVDEARLVGEDDRLGAVSDTGFGEGMIGVGADGGFSEVKGPGDLGVGQAAGYLDEHLAPAGGDAIEAGEQVGRGLDQRQMSFDESSGHGRGEQGLAGSDDPDRSRLVWRSPWLSHNPSIVGSSPCVAPTPGLRHVRMTSPR
jgi:hypothetical protein